MLAWLFVIMLVPVIGMIAYFFIGRNYRRASQRRVEVLARWTRLAERSLGPTLAANAGFSDAVVGEHGGHTRRRVEGTGRREDGIVPLPSDTVEIYTAGSQKFPRLLEEMATAREATSTSCTSSGSRTSSRPRSQRSCSTGSRPACRSTSSTTGSAASPTRRTSSRSSPRAGAVVVPCFKHLSHINYRNHMKMVIIDGKSVYSGGMNMGPEYIDGGPRFAVWRDTSFRLSGPVVRPT